MLNKLPDAQITPDKKYLHSVPIACEFFSSLLPRTKLIILEPSPTSTLTLPDHQSLRLFTPGGMYNSKTMIGSDRGFVVCKCLRPSEVFHQNDVSNQKGRIRASHHRHTFTSRTSTFQVEVGVLYLILLVCVLTRTKDSRLK